MTSPELVIRGSRIVLPGGIAAASIHIRDGRIEKVCGDHEIPSTCAVIDADEASLVMPGLVDTHVHINEPGRTDWEGFSTATLAAAAGGVTTLVDMPLNSIPPTTTVAGLTAKLQAAANQCHVDVAFWGGVVPGNTDQLAGLNDAGVVGFKCFLVPSGVDEFQHVTERDLRESMPEITRLGSMLIVHAELPGPIDDVADSVREPHDTYQAFLMSRPRAAENEAVALMIRLSKEFGTRVHIVHLSSADAVPLLRKAQSEGVQITAETCPHYLHLAAEDVPAGATEFKCCPPVRERENREQLWRGLADGTIGIIVSDHSPCPGDLKLKGSGDFLKAWGGIASLQLRLPVVWTEAQRRGFSFSELMQWLCRGPANQVRLQRKGSIDVGFDADIVIWNPDDEFRVDSEMLRHRHKVTPYAGETLRGVVKKTFLRGRKIYDDGEFLRTPAGRLILTS